IVSSIELNKGSSIHLYSPNNFVFGYQYLSLHANFFEEQDIISFGGRTHQVSENTLKWTFNFNVWDFEKEGNTLRVMILFDSQYEGYIEEIVEDNNNNNKGEIIIRL